MENIGSNELAESYFDEESISNINQAINDIYVIASQWLGVKLYFLLYDGHDANQKILKFKIEANKTTDRTWRTVSLTDPNTGNQKEYLLNVTSPKTDQTLMKSLKSYSRTRLPSNVSIK
ncbi:MAG: hypothetical protein OHK0017_04590 [Patescibacteria group bacterium]